MTTILVRCSCGYSFIIELVPIDYETAAFGCAFCHSLVFFPWPPGVPAHAVG